MRDEVYTRNIERKTFIREIKKSTLGGIFIHLMTRGHIIVSKPKNKTKQNKNKTQIMENTMPK